MAMKQKHSHDQSAKNAFMALLTLIVMYGIATLIYS